MCTFGNSFYCIFMRMIIFKSSEFVSALPLKSVNWTNLHHLFASFEVKRLLNNWLLDVIPATLTRIWFGTFSMYYCLLIIRIVLANIKKQKFFITITFWIYLILCIAFLYISFKNKPNIISYKTKNLKDMQKPSQLSYWYVYNGK